MCLFLDISDKNEKFLVRMQDKECDPTGDEATVDRIWHFLILQLY